MGFEFDVGCAFEAGACYRARTVAVGKTTERKGLEAWRRRVVFLHSP